jgi:hypothetical protein
MSPKDINAKTRAAAAATQKPSTAEFGLLRPGDEFKADGRPGWYRFRSAVLKDDGSLAYIDAFGPIPGRPGASGNTPAFRCINPDAVQMPSQRKINTGRRTRGEATPTTDTKQGGAMTATTKKAATTTKAAPKQQAAPKATAPKKERVLVQYFRDGNPITNPSVNSLSGVAFFHTKGWKPESQRVVKDGETLDRVNVDTLAAWLAKHGVKDPKTAFGPVTLPGGQAISATVGELAPHVPRTPKEDTPEAKAKKEADAKAVEGVKAARKKLASEGAAAVAKQYGAAKPKPFKGPLPKPSQAKGAAKKAS